MGRVAIDQRHVRARGTLEGPAIVLAAPRPGQGGPKRVGRVGRGQDMGGPGERIRVGWLAHGAQPVERARERELGGTESVHEVAAPDPAGLLEGVARGTPR